MRLSEAAELGRTITKMCIGDWMGCYLGAAANAVGIVGVKKYNHTEIEGAQIFDSRERCEAIKDYWPWLASNNDQRMMEIITLYDQGMSFEKLNAYVKTIEPPCGDCSTFDCCCTRTELTFEEMLKDERVWEPATRQ